MTFKVKTKETRENPLPTGFEAYSVAHLKNLKSVMSPAMWNQLCIVKDKKPTWWYGKAWRQTYSFQEKSKAKKYGWEIMK